MDLKKKLKRFFTLTRKANDGFTLVELIIVIAILAILAGAAVPAYNGYTKKAREAADQMIVAAANDAFAAACMENKVDAMNVTEATVSVLENRVAGLGNATYGSDNKFGEKIAPSFMTYFAENGEMIFQTAGINSLVWNDVLDTFEMSENGTGLIIVTRAGKTLTISEEDMAMIQASAYADMGAAEVAATITELTESNKGLVDLAKALRLGGKFSAVLLANGLVSDTSEADAMSASEVSNGLQMVTAKYLAGASEEEIQALLSVDVGGNLPLIGGTTEGMLQNIADGTGGTKTVSAAALQYALMESYANNPEYATQTVTYKPSIFGKNQTVSVSEFLESDYAKEDPIRALNIVQDSAGYQNYMTTEQYNKDVDGFVGTMSVLGDNIGTVNNPGAIDINDYFNNGVNGNDAQDALTAVLGK